MSSFRINILIYFPRAAFYNRYPLKVTDCLRCFSGVDRVYFRVPLSNPRERDRVNSVNSRLLNTKGEIRMMVDPTKAPQTVRDFEGVVVIEGGSGEIDKHVDPERTHLSDAVGYHLWQEYPVKKQYSYDVGTYWK